MARTFNHGTYGEIGSVSDEQEAAIREASFDYVWDYGMKQSLQDSVAGAAAYAKKHDMTPAAAARALFQKRRRKMITGTMAVREIGPRNPFETACMDIAEERVVAALKAKGLKKPDNFKDLVAGVRAKHADVIEAEAQERLERADNIEVDLEGLLD